MISTLIKMNIKMSAFSAMHFYIYKKIWERDYYRNDRARRKN